MAFFFKSFQTASETTTEVGSETEWVPEDCAAAENPESSTCKERGFQSFSEVYEEDHKMWHEHLRSREPSANAQLCPSTTERYLETEESAVEIKTEKPDYSTAEVTPPAMTCQPQMLLKPFACEYCGWRFILRKDLVHHVRTHTGEKPYSCSDCGKQFARAHSLNLHRGRRDGSEEDKPYSCNKCPRRFWTKGCYLSHYKSTHEEWPQPQTATLQVKSAVTVEIGSSENNQEPNNTVNINDVSHIVSLPLSTCAAGFTDECTSSSNSRYCPADLIINEESNQVIRFPGTPIGGGKRGVRFTCQYCGWGFWDKKDRKQHEWTHTGIKPYQCTECGKNFSRSYTLKLHMRAHAGEKPFSCQYCGKTFTGPGSLRLHTKVHTKVHKHKCPVCPMSFKRMDFFKIHQKEHLNSTSGSSARWHSSRGKSDISQNIQNDGNALPHPINLLLAQPVMQSESCDRVGVANDTYNIMLPPQGETVRTLCNGEEPFVANIASISPKECKEEPVFITLPSASPGLQRPAKDPYVLARICSKPTAGLKRKPLPTGGRTFKCRYCEATFRDPFGRDSHEQTHTKSPSFECKICKRAFKQQSSFARHLRSHKKENSNLFLESYPTGTDSKIPAEKYFSWGLSFVDDSRDCASKAKTTAPQESLRGTIQDIDWVKKAKVTSKRLKRPFRFSCGYCPQRFRDKKDWRQHENTHTGFKPYSCSVCGRKLTRQYSLKKHMMTHTGEKPVSCTHCNKAFRHKSGLLSHQKNHHPWLLDHTCCFCKTTHEDTDALESHLRYDHDDVIRTLVKQFFSDDQCINAAVDSTCLSPPKQSDCRVQTNPADFKDIAVRYLSKRERRINQVTAAAIDLWLKCEGHEMITEIPKFRCSFCDKGFQNRKDWQRHENSHTGYKPYVCDICGKRISRLHSLKAHKLTHSVTPAYVCRHCGKGFCKQLSLVKHKTSKHCRSLGAGLMTTDITEPNKTTADHEDISGNLDTDMYNQVLPGPSFSPQEMNSADLNQSSSTICMSKMPSFPFQHQCAYCKWKFSDVNVLRRHGCWLKRLFGKAIRRKKVWCDNCGEIFRTKELLDVHLKTCGVICDLCHTSFTTNDKLKRHLELIHSHKTANPLNVKQEKLDATAEDISKQTACDLNSSRSLSIRNADDTGNSVSFPTTGLQVNIPLQKTRKRVVITCRICQKNFTHRYALKLHLMMHASETRYQCQLCPKRFRSKKGLKKHFQNHLSSQGSLFATDANNPDVEASLILKEQSTTNDSGRPQVKKARADLDARRSESQIPQLKPHQCTYCGWGFWSRKDCIVHERTHTGEKPYACETCDKRFARCYPLKLHALTHKGLKPFRCKYCNKGFSTGSYVKIHERNHAQEHP